MEKEWYFLYFECFWDNLKRKNSMLKKKVFKKFVGISVKIVDLENAEKMNKLNKKINFLEEK